MFRRRGEASDDRSSTEASEHQRRLLWKPIYTAYRKILRMRGRGRDGPNDTEEPQDVKYSSKIFFKEYIPDELVKNDEYLVRNGTFLFKELVKSTHGKINSIRIFSIKELQKATNSFSRDRCNEDSVPRTYRGIIEDTYVAVKIPSVLLNFVDEVVSLSLIKHKNVAKLLGCCLETRYPIVILELPPNGTLQRKVFHGKTPPVLELLWTDRLRIATEIADALAYLHNALHVTHGRLWYAEAVLLDEFHSAKLCAFDFSEIHNQGKSFESCDVETDNNRIKYRKREDVYDFGIILSNLLGIDFGEVGKWSDKVEILKYLKLNVSEKEMPQVEAYIDLMLRCVSLDRNKQPSVKEVVGEDEVSMKQALRELRRITTSVNQPTDRDESDDLSNNCLFIKE